MTQTILGIIIGFLVILESVLLFSKLSLESEILQNNVDIAAISAVKANMDLRDACDTISKVYKIQECFLLGSKATVEMSKQTIIGNITKTAVADIKRC